MQAVVLALAERQLSVDVLNHDDGAVDDDAEVNGAYGQKIRRTVVRVQNDEGKEQRQRNRKRDDDGRANADQEKDKDNQHQHHAAQQVGFNRVGGEPHQLAAIVVGMDLHIGREDRAVQLIGLRLDSFKNVLRLLAAQHENDAFDSVIVVLIAELAEARGVADLHRTDISYADGHAIIATDNNVANVVRIA